MNTREEVSCKEGVRLFLAIAQGLLEGKYKMISGFQKSCGTKIVIHAHLVLEKGAKCQK